MAKDKAPTAASAPKEKAPKTRVTARLKESMGVAKARNRSADLVKLEEHFRGFCKKLKSLVVVLKQQHAAMSALAKSRFQVAAEVAKLSERSPMFECVGELSAPDRPNDTVCSYLSIHKQMAEKAKSYTAKYGQFVVEYVLEWEKVLTNRISVGLKKAESLRVDLDHYQQKVEALRQSANQTMVKGKSVDGRTADKLSRNEEKFVKAKQEYDVFATDLCILMEEVTERGWRDLHPLMVKLAQFDATMSDDEAKLMATLNQVVHQLKDIATRHGVSPQARLKDIEHLKPELLNTRVGGTETLRIEGDNGGSVFGTASTTSSLPPGSVGPQGLGGFPVAIGNSDAAAAEDRARTNSFGSYDSGLVGSTTSGDRGTPGRSSTFNITGQRTMRPAPGAPSTYDILQMSSAAAPPPTMDQLNDAYPMGRTASGTFGLPPLAPPSYGGDASSVYSSATAPAPMAPPPPPPNAPPPPPPPAMGMMYPVPSNFGAPAPAYGQAPAPNSYGQQPSWNSGYPQQQQQQQQQQQPQYGMPPQPNYGQPPSQQPNYGQPPQHQQQQQQQGYHNPYNNAQNHQQRSNLNSNNPFNN